MAEPPDSQLIADTMYAYDDTLATELPRYTLRLPQAEARQDQEMDTLPVIFTAEYGRIAGFSLKVGLDSDLASIAGVLPGDFVDSCNWDLFTGRDVSGEPREGYPTSVHKIVGLARTVPDSTTDECFRLDGPVPLAYLLIEYSAASLTADTVIPIFFFWEECADNTLSGMAGEAIIMSHQVHNYIGEAIAAGDDVFPTRRGTPRQCIRPGTHNTPLRSIDFHSGSLTFKPLITSDSLSPDTSSAEND